VLLVMERLAKGGMTMLLVTHEMNFARRVADIVVFMHGGLIWESGPPSVVLATPRTPELAAFVKAEIG
jgi:polar amino acid transport system ATP-binding protein